MVKFNLKKFVAFLLLFFSLTNFVNAKGEIVDNAKILSSETKDILQKELNSLGTDINVLLYTQRKDFDISNQNDRKFLDKETFKLYEIYFGGIWQKLSQFFKGNLPESKSNYLIVYYFGPQVRDFYPSFHSWSSCVFNKDFFVEGFDSVVEYVGSDVSVNLGSSDDLLKLKYKETLDSIVREHNYLLLFTIKKRDDDCRAEGVGKSGEWIYERYGNEIRNSRTNLRDSTFKIKSAVGLGTGFFYAYKKDNKEYIMLITAAHVLVGAFDKRLNFKNTIHYKGKEYKIDNFIFNRIRSSRTDIVVPSFDAGVIISKEFEDEYKRGNIELTALKRYNKPLDVDRPVCIYRFPGWKGDILAIGRLWGQLSKQKNVEGTLVITMNRGGPGTSGSPVIYCGTNEVLGVYTKAEVYKTGQYVGYAFAENIYDLDLVLRSLVGNK